MNIVAIIPVYKLTGDRFENFKFVIHSLLNSSIKNIHIVEQTSDNTQVSNFLKFFKEKILHKRLELNISNFNKSHLLNSYINSINFDYIWMIDADVYMNFDEVIKNFSKKSELIRPYSHLFRLNKSQTEYIKYNSFNPEKIKEGNANNYFGKYSYIVKQSKFLEVGGYDEHYHGWGFQDLDIIHRIKKTNPITSSTPNYAYHLHHKHADTIFYEHNKKRFYDKLKKT